MNEQEYRDMYAEYCMESGTRMTDRGFTPANNCLFAFVYNLRIRLDP